MLRRDDKTILGGVVIALTLLAVVAIDSTWLQSRFEPAGELVRAQFRNTGQLKKDDKVRIDGVEVGRVEDIELDADGRSATVEMRVQKTGLPLYSDARAILRWRTVLGANFAVDIEPGTPEAGDIGDSSIPVEQTTNQVEIEDLIAFNKGDARDGMRVMLKELPDAFRDRDVLADASSELAASSPALATALSASRGQRERDLRPLIQSTSRTVNALDTSTDSMRDVVEGAAATMRTTAAREHDLREMLVRGAGIQPRVQTTLVRLNRTLDLAEPLVTRLHAPAASLDPTLERLRPTLVAADRMLQEARPLLRRLRPAVTSLATTARRGRPLLAALEPGMSRLAKRILPELARTDQVTKLRTYQMIGPVVAGLNSAAATFDAESHVFRFPAAAGQRAVADDLPCSTWFGDPESEAAIRCDSLGDALDTYFGWQPVPPPGGGR